MATNKDLKRIVMELKTKLGITQSQLAVRLGVNSSYLSSVVNGRFPMSENLMTKIKMLNENSDLKFSAQSNETNAAEVALTPQESSAIISKLMGMIDNLQMQVNEDRKLLNTLVDKILTQK